MPVCLLCPSSNRPSFVKTDELSNHISEAHATTRSVGNVVPTALPHKPAGNHRCCICNKKFTSSGALASHQSAKKHYARDLAPTSNSEELASHPEAHGISSSTANANASTDKPGVAERRVIHDDSPARLETPPSSHKHQGVEPSCSRQADLVSDVVIAPHRSASPVIIRPASSQSNNVGVSLKSHVKGFACEHCNKIFKSLAGLQTHTAAKHLAGAMCVICHFICPSTVALEEHVVAVHACAVCHDGILRNAQTLSDHMIEHSHPILCKRCGTRYRTEDERKLHFKADDNDHPVCVTCCLGFEDDQAFRVHANSVHPTSPQPSVKPSSPRFSAEFGADTHVPTEHPGVFRCDICHEAHSSQTELDVHAVTVHSCPICHDGTYMDMRSLEEHLEQHRSPYTCRTCGLAYAEEDQLLEHYRDSPRHPHCEKCQLGFENDDTYTLHVDEIHPRVACDVCGSDFFDQGELAVHYSTSRNHPKCEKCGVGFRDRFDYTEHGATEHPECHCYLCQWHFDTPDILQNHIRHFSNHPKCRDCDIRFADANAYQYHLFTIHRPRFGNQGNFDIPTNREAKSAHGDCSSPSMSARAFDPILGLEGSASLPYASYVPLPPSLSGYSSPTSQRAIAEPGGSSRSHSRSSTLSVEQRPPMHSQQWNGTIQSPTNLDIDQDCKVSPNFNHSPLSTLPAVGTPVISGAPTIQSADFRSPFSPRPEPPSLFSLSQGTGNPAVTVVEHDDVDSESSSSFTRSPPLVSPIVKLPDPRPGSPASASSSWTMTTDADSRRSMPHRQSISLSNGISSTVSTGQNGVSDHIVPPLTLLLPNSVPNSGCPSSISPESAGISVSATMTPEYLREARAYLSLTHEVQEAVSPASPRSPGISSPVLSSTGLALGGRGRRREVRFEDNIMSESAWDRHSTSSDSSLDPPVVLPRPGTGGLRMNGVSKLPRFSALRRPNRRWTSGQTNHVYLRGHNRRPNGVPAPSYHCRSCYKDQCDEPTTTTCGHLFCYECISTAVMKDARCPVCDAPTLLYCLFRIDTSA